MHEHSNSNSLLFTAFPPLPILVRLNLSGFISCRSIGLYLWFPPPSLSFSVVHSPLSLHRTVRAPCYGSFVAGHYWHAWVAALLWVHQWLLLIILKCLACACSASPAATWLCWTHAPSALWTGLPKEPPQANSTFYFFIIFCSFCTSYWRFVNVLRDLNEAISVWSISLFSVLRLLIWFSVLLQKKNHIIIIQVRSNRHHFDWFYFAPGLFSVYKCSLNTADILRFVVYDMNHKLCMGVDL